MILYFSGTGNSEYVANRIAKAIQDDILNLFERIKHQDVSALHSERPWIIVVPTYAWRIPRIVRKWIEDTPLCGSREIYFVMTCGGNISNAGKYLKTLCMKKNMNYLGCMEIVMPENYIALFSTPSKQQASDIIDKAEPIIDETIALIQNNKPFDDEHITWKDQMNSGIVNDLFYPLFVHAKKFYADERCISCGTCVTVCPLNNISLVSQKPIWAKNCTHCMACINHCPTQAIEYGKHTKGQPRYVFQKHK